MITAKPIFLETLSSTTRKTLVAERIAAMRGRINQACINLEKMISLTPTDKNADLAAIGLLWSELLYLNGQEVESIAIFRRYVEPLQSSLPVTVQLVLTDNLSILQMADLNTDAVSTFYHNVDRCRIAQFQSTDSLNLLAAQREIENNNFTQALPLLWQNLLRSYGLGSWKEMMWASERLAKLYLKAGALEKASYYLIVADADKEIEQLANAVSILRDQEIIHSILRQLMDFANLRRHFIVACKFIAKIPDLIPDEEVENLAEWLLPRCREIAHRNGGGAMRAAWEVLRGLGPRLSPTTSCKLIDIAITHPEWTSPIPGENRVLPNREDMVKAVTFLAHSAPTEYLDVVAEATLPLATERMQHDYVSVVNLLCKLSQLSGYELRTRIKTVLYVSDKPVTRVLAQVADFFGVEALNTGQWEEFANRVMEEILLTVQWLRPGETPKPVEETYMVSTKSTPTGQLQVIIQSGHGLEALARGQQYLSNDTIERIIRTLVQMATNCDNLLSNREQLLSKLCDFADRAQPRLREEVVHALEPLARGDAIESLDNPKAKTGQPFAPFSMNMGTPQQVQAMALVAAATFCGPDSALSRMISDAMLEGFVNPQVTVRKGAYTAARRLPDLSSEQLLPVLMGLRDSDPVAAISAFAAFAERKEWQLNRPMWKLFLLATRLAMLSPNTNLRRHAALALRSRTEQAPTEVTKAEANTILNTFAKDVAYSVRKAVC